MNQPNTVEILKSLADDTRLSLVRQLVTRGCEVPSSDLIHSCSEVLKLSQPTISHHFSRLVQAGILLDRKVGTEKYYRINSELLTATGINPEKL